MSVKENFKDFHRANPIVFELFEIFAEEAISAGAGMLSSKFIINRIRWEAMISTTGTKSGRHPVTGKPYKIDDRFTPWYARLYMLKYPSRASLFETRRIRTK